MRYKAVYLHVVVLVCLISVCGCSSFNPEDIQAFEFPDKTGVTADNYILQPPDEIEIHCSKVPEIHLQSQQIRPDGKVAFEALGEIHAAGRTPRELANELSAKIMMLYALTGDNPIDVRIVAYKSKFYYVVGQVYYNGPKEFTGRDTLLTALSKARPTILGWLERVRVIRPSVDKNTKAKIFEVDYRKMIAKGDLSKNVLLQEGDIVYVPPTVLAWLSMKIEEAVRPIGRAFSTVNIVQGPPGR